MDGERDVRMIDVWGKCGSCVMQIIASVHCCGRFMALWESFQLKLVSFILKIRDRYGTATCPIIKPIL